MSPNPAKAVRSRWGMARFELETNYDHIQSVMANSPNYTAAFDALVESGHITITYSAFIRTWRKLCNEKGNPDAAQPGPTRTVPASIPVTADTKPRKALPSIGTFSMPTGSDEVNKRW